jgi:hypothetical protein
MSNFKHFGSVLILSCLLITLSNCAAKTANRIENFEKTKMESRRVCSPNRPPTEFDRYFDDTDFAGRLEKAGEVSAILEKLAAEREMFLKTGDYRYIFPILYFHTTNNIFNDAIRSKSPNPHLKLEMVIRFYDAYKSNADLFEKGGAEAVEPHWKNYFRKAEKFDRGTKDIDTATEVLLDGIDAHVNYDIPRFVRYFAEKRPEQKQLLKREFEDIDSVFQRAADSAFENILHSLRLEDTEFNRKLYKFGASYIIYARKKAWELGVGKNSLPTDRSQPVFEHNMDSRKFFPPELLKSGICHISDKQ